MVQKLPLLIGCRLSLLFIFFFWLGQADATEIYQVQRGDNLWSLSQRWGVAVEEIKGLNFLFNDSLVVGQVLTIPSRTSVNRGGITVSSANPLPPTDTNHDTPFLYRVKEGDTLSLLARQWGVTEEEIKTANKNFNNHILPNQILVMPKNAVKNPILSKPLTKSREEWVSRQETVVDRGGYRNVANLAQSFLGVPYVAGSTNPLVGFDCSGFTNYVHSLVGMKLPRTSSEQYNIGLPIEREQLMAGDLVFFSINGRSVNHVGIYLGSGQFISATLSRGIAVDSLDSAYWGPRYLGARRIV